MRVIKRQDNYMPTLMAEMANIELGKTHYLLTQDGPVINPAPASYPTLRFGDVKYTVKHCVGVIYVPHAFSQDNFSSMLKNEYVAFLEDAKLETLREIPYTMSTLHHTSVIIRPSQRLSGVVSGKHSSNFVRIFCPGDQVSTSARFSWVIKSTRQYKYRPERPTAVIFCDFEDITTLDDLAIVNEITKKHTTISSRIVLKIRGASNFRQLLSEYWRSMEIRAPRRFCAGQIQEVPYEDIAPAGLTKPTCARCDGLIYGMAYCVFNEEGAGAPLCVLCAHHAPGEVMTRKRVLAFKSPVSIEDATAGIKDEVMRDFCIEYSKGERAHANVSLIGDKYILVNYSDVYSMAFAKKYANYIGDRMIVLR